MTDHDRRFADALAALEGLSAGDAFGECFFRPPFVAHQLIEARQLPEAPWIYTDDTEMAIAIVEVLRDYEGIDQDALARRFAERYAARPDRGYGGGAHRILSEIGAGGDWREIAGAAFGGEGSFGNGGAMRVAPLGAYFADDLDRAAREAQKSAEITHAHREGQAGAIAIAVAAGVAVQMRHGEADPGRLFEETLARIPGETAVRENVRVASEFPRDAAPGEAADRLGSGGRVSAMDTCGYCLWCAARHLDDYVDAMWNTVAGLGDRDTTCAIVGGIVAARLGRAAVPSVWREAREEIAVLASP